MAELPVLKTKLYKPPITKEHVLRKELVNQLEYHANKPLTLISASAGYGKSILVSSFLEEHKTPYAWVSLSEAENNLYQFMNYLIESIHLTYPNKLDPVRELIAGFEAPPQSKLIQTIINCFDAMEDRFILVLDDYHYINEVRIHEIIEGILEYPPANINICITTRVDPPINIGLLRAYNKILEIRSSDLAFNAADTNQLYNNLLGIVLSRETSDKLLQETEGWITGLRLAAYTVTTIEELENILKKMKGNFHFVAEYLVEEVLSKQSPVFREYLVSISLVDHFCLEIVESIILQEGKSKTDSSAEEFMNWLVSSNLFIVSLDDDQKWFRFHHEFKKLLMSNLVKHNSIDQIKIIHKRASDAFERIGLIEEALKHSISAGEPVEAAKIIERNRSRMMDLDQWHIFINWLEYIPVEIQQKRPVLLLIRAWICYERSQVEDLVDIVERLGKILKGKKADPKLLGEFHFFMGYFEYFQGNAEISRDHLEKAYAAVKGDPGYLKGEVEVMLGLARQMTGSKDIAVKSLKKSISEAAPQNLLYLTRLYGALAFMFVLSGEFGLAEKATMKMKKLAEKQGTVHTLSWAHYLLAQINFLSNNLTGASEHFQWIIDKRFFAHNRVSVDCFAGLARTYQAFNQHEKVKEILDEMITYTNSKEDSECILVAQSCCARISLLQNDLSAAADWANSFDLLPEISSLFLWIQSPYITKARIMIAIGTEESLDSADKLLKQLLDIVVSAKFRCHEPNILVLQSIVNSKMGKTRTALNKLKKALEMTQIEGFIRPFLEEGNVLVDLLNQIDDKGIFPEFKSKILNELTKSKKTDSPISNFKKKSNHAKGSVEMMDMPSMREKEVLVLLELGMSNKEIAAELSLSPLTIKKHIYNLYLKLNVSSRINAVSKAKELGIL